MKYLIDLIISATFLLSANYGVQYADRNYNMPLVILKDKEHTPRIGFQLT